MVIFCNLTEYVWKPCCQSFYHFFTVFFFYSAGNYKDHGGIDGITTNSGMWKGHRDNGGIEGQTRGSTTVTSQKRE